MDRFVVKSIVALGTGLSVVLLAGLIELQPVGATPDGYGAISVAEQTKISTS